MRWGKLTSCLSLLMAAIVSYERAYEGKRSYEMPSSALEPTYVFAHLIRPCIRAAALIWNAIVCSGPLLVWSWMSYERVYECGCLYGMPSSALDFFSIFVKASYDCAYERECSYDTPSFALSPLVNFRWSYPCAIRPAIRPQRSYERPSFALSPLRLCFLW